MYLNVKYGGATPISVRATQPGQPITIPYSGASADIIEAFDNSNLFGEYPVSAMVCFVNGVKSPKDYRKYKITWRVNQDETLRIIKKIFRKFRFIRIHIKQWFYFLIAYTYSPCNFAGNII